MFWLILAFPLIWPVLAKAIFRHSINFQEFALQIGVCTLLCVGTWYGGIAAKTHDVEILNGEVTGKYSEHVSCEHSYSCRCHTVGKGNDAHQECDTCYDHSYDVSWYVATNLGDIKIDRVNRRGDLEPPRFTTVQVGEPASIDHSYTNWVKAADKSLFHADPILALKYQGKLPDYPGVIYDYYRINRVITSGMSVAGIDQWNTDLSTVLEKLGPARQVNSVIVFTNDASPDFADALRAYWMGGKKNDLVTVIGTPHFPDIEWARVFSWSKDPTVDIEIRDQLQELGSAADRSKVIGIIANEIRAHFVRRPMADFEYLKSEIDPPTWVVVMMAIFAIPGSLFLTWFFYRNDIDFTQPRGFRINRTR